MDWSQIANNPLLENMPFKVEQSKYGQLMLTPASNCHGHIEYQIGRAIKKGRNREGGQIIVECAIQTSEGVKVADVAWASDGFIEKHGFATPCPQAPELCVEVVSPSKSDEEMTYKAGLYLAAGAIEVWVVDENKRIQVHAGSGKLTQSKLVKLMEW